MLSFHLAILQKHVFNVFSPVNSLIARILQNITNWDQYYTKKIISLVLMSWVYAFSCDSSTKHTLCMSNRISCKQRVSCKCVKVYDTSDRLNPCKRSCTDCMQTVSLQYAAACVSWDDQRGWMNSCTDHNWNASPLNVLSCAVWGDPFL